MYFKDIGFLCKEKITLDKHKRPKVKYDEEKIFCNVKSVGMNEFYQATTAGFKPEVKIEAKLIDINGATHFKYNDKLYKILRINKKEDITEIVLTSMVINNESS